MHRYFLNLAIIIVALLFIGNLGYYAYSLYQRSNFCNQFMVNYLKNPPTDIYDYTNKDYVFDELCSPTNDVYALFSNLFLIGLLVYFSKKRYKKGTKPLAAPNA